MGYLLDEFFSEKQKPFYEEMQRELRLISSSENIQRSEFAIAMKNLEFEESYNQKLNALVQEFMQKFCVEGAID